MTTTTTPTPMSETGVRVRVGVVMILAMLAIFIGDHWLYARGVTWFPCLLVCVVGLTVLGVLELHALFGPFAKPPLWLLLTGCLSLVGVGWPANLGYLGTETTRPVEHVFTVFVLAGFLYEMAVFREPGSALVRLALYVFALAYLGLLPSFLVHLRWLGPRGEADGLRDLPGMIALVLVIFVPKVCDIGAYFTGKLIGRTPMTPLLSPKKTYEGLAGGLACSTAFAVAMQVWGYPLLPGPAEAAAFGLTLGVAGVLGDLAESLLKRECRQKDASHVVPGFGGVLDVVDSILFAAPVACWWLRA